MLSKLPSSASLRGYILEAELFFKEAFIALIVRFRCWFLLLVVDSSLFFKVFPVVMNTHLPYFSIAVLTI